MPAAYRYETDLQAVSCLGLDSKDVDRRWPSFASLVDQLGSSVRWSFNCRPGPLFLKGGFFCFLSTVRYTALFRAGIEPRTVATFFGVDSQSC
jgi:hypothetical protein